MSNAFEKSNRGEDRHFLYVYIASYVFRQSEKCCFCAIVLSVASLSRIQYLFGHEVFLYLIVNNFLEILGE